MWKRNKININNKKNIQIQCIDWKVNNIKFSREYDSEYENSDEEDDGEEKQQLEYNIKLFGINQGGESICVNVEKFTPYFFIEIPETIQWKKSHTNYLKSYITKQINDSNLSSMVNDLLSIGVVNRQKMYNFSNFKKFKFIRLVFRNSILMKFCERLFNKYIKLDCFKRKFKFIPYETNIEPLLRFFHIRDVSPAGWIEINSGKYEVIREDKVSRCQIEITTDWKNINNLKNDTIGKITQASFDIECDSSHGDFPLPIKDYSKLTKDILDLYRKIKFKNLEEKQNFIHLCLKQAFEIEVIDLHNIKYNINNVFTKKTKKPNLTKIENVSKTITSVFTQYKTKDEHLEHITTVLNDHFPDVEGDKVIQIGITVQKYGELDCSHRHILTLGGCNKIKNSTVEAFKDEKSLLLSFVKFIQTLDPDIITGYNIFGFDWKYLYDRAIELKIVKQFCNLGRLVDKPSEYKEKTLASSALGDNILKYISTDGRVQFDLMKVVQRDYKLDSYKLDFVAEDFINDEVIEVIEKNKLKVKGHITLNENNFITLFISGNKYNDGEKFKIINIEDNVITLNKNIDSLSTKGSIKWRLAKDDVGPQDIFRLQKGNDADRATVAAYCLQDCALVNKLVTKLCILSNNLAMANVCTVPFSYLFMRGQGIKIFSLVAKECRKDNMLIPVVRKDDNAIDEGYEGAIVLDPIPGIYDEYPITVCDYNSLYPSSMIERNISHDSIVVNKQYDNLPGIKYINVTYDSFK